MYPVVRFVAVCAFILAAFSPGAGFAAPVGPLNIVLILADDLGWADLGCHGADLHETPRIDAFAREGLRFNQAYAMPVCSPTRDRKSTRLNSSHSLPSRMPSSA